jgi:hypothetical protein
MQESIRKAPGSLNAEQKEDEDIIVNELKRMAQKEHSGRILDFDYAFDRALIMLDREDLCY